MVQELARTTLTVDLSASLDLASTCTPDLAPGGTPVTCTLTVTHPDPGDAPPAVDVAELSVASAPTSLLPAGGLVLDPGSAGSWTCTAATCTLDGGSELPAGATSTFTWTSTAASTQDGGDVAVTSTLDYGIGTPDRQASAADDITVVGAGDTDLEVIKTALTTTARPGERVAWSVTVQNVGGAGAPGDLDARTVALTDAASDAVEGLTIAFVGGAGDWTCTGSGCSAATMPPGTATFLVEGTLAAGAPAGSAVVNQVDVTWDNDVRGPDFPAVAGASLEVGATPPPAPAPAPSSDVPRSLAFTG